MGIRGDQNSYFGEIVGGDAEGVSRGRVGDVLIHFFGDERGEQ